MVTSSPLPTCSSPSQLVSMDAGLKSSEKDKYWVYVSPMDNQRHLTQHEQHMGKQAVFEVCE